MERKSEVDEFLKLLSQNPKPVAIVVRRKVFRSLFFRSFSKLQRKQLAGENVIYVWDKIPGDLKFKLYFDQQSFLIDSEYEHRGTSTLARIA